MSMLTLHYSRAPTPERSPLTLAWLAALWMGIPGNWPLWRQLMEMSQQGQISGAGFTLVFGAVVCAALGALLSLLAWRPLIKPLLSVLLLATAVQAHFMGSYGIVIDPSMIINTLQTDARETRDLINLQFIGHVFFLAVLPMVWLWRQSLPRGRWWPRLGRNLLSAALGLALAVGFLMLSFAEASSTMRNHKSLRYMINPLNGLWSAGAALAQTHQQPKGPPQVVGQDARLRPLAPGSKPPLLVLVVGETARAANFSLNGYARPTNPELARLPVTSFTQVTSCGTSTAASLPCMFSHLGREAFTSEKPHQENLLDVLQRAGLAVLWLDNQSGCKGVCDRVPSAQAINPVRSDKPLPQGLCGADGECFDEALLHDLDGRLAALDAQRRARGVVLVLHQMGSHGPAYFKRTPEQLKPFVPECRSSALQRCPTQELHNAYDNTIAYTDRVLARTVAWLEQQQQHYNPALVYVSDHGESLGENGLYLHGMPYAMAPDEQKHIPLVMWLPPATAQAAGVDARCLTDKRHEPRSHDGLFHTMVRLGGVSTTLYRAEWDWLNSCNARTH
ncbi:phosphoethanolamine transferase [Roseateles sp. BYS180W]|uniref:Phosphoethanolamine transferase n=1 Tax=Roseateles rivi TaxID=3299028 RepID=A0ABW7FVS5_9BURK